MTIKNEKYFFATLGLGLFVYLVMRAILVPLAHDESATFFHYVQPQRFIPFQAHWDANNHVLNSALSVLFYNLFGKSVFVLRLANVLAFLFYLYYAARIAGRLNTTALRILTFTALVTSTFVFEFFALSRGYGLSMAFLLATIWYFICHSETGKNKWLVLCLLSASLAVWANLSLLMVVLVLLSIIGYNLIFSYVKTKKVPLRAVVIFMVAGITPFYLATLYSLALKEHGALYYGTLEGFIPVTLVSLLYYQVGSSHVALQILVACIFFLGVGVGLWIWIKNRFGIIRTLESMALLLLGSFTGTIMLAYLLEVNFPEDRAALYFIPLFILMVGFALDAISKRNRAWSYEAFIWLFFPLHFLFHINTSVSLLWPDQSFPKKFYDRIANEQSKTSEELTVSCYMLHEINWAFYDLDSKNPLNPPQISGHPSTLSHWQILSRERWRKVKDNYTIVDEDPGFNQVLAKRKTTLKRTPWVTVYIHPGNINGEEFIGIYKAPSDSIPRQPLLLRLEMELKSNEKPLEVQVVIAAKDNTGKDILYDYTKLHWIKSQWNGETYAFSKCMEVLPATTREFGIYLWNIEKKQMQIKNLRMELFSLTQPE